MSAFTKCTDPVFLATYLDRWRQGQDAEGVAASKALAKVAFAAIRVAMQSGCTQAEASTFALVVAANYMNDAINEYADAEDEDGTVH